MSFGEDGRRISPLNLLSRPGQFGLDREHAEDLMKRMGTTVAQCWREGLLPLGAEPRSVDRFASWFDFADEPAGAESDTGKPVVQDAQVQRCGGNRESKVAQELLESECEAVRRWSTPQASRDEGTAVAG